MTFSNITWMHLPASGLVFFLTPPRSGNIFSPSLLVNSQGHGSFSILQQKIRNKQHDCPKFLKRTRSKILKQSVTICFQPRRTFHAAPREGSGQAITPMLLQPSRAPPVARPHSPGDAPAALPALAWLRDHVAPRSTRSFSDSNAAGGTSSCRIRGPAAQDLARCCW